MGDGGRDGAGLETVALDVADADVIGVLMTLDHRDLEDILLDADLAGIACVGGDDLAGDHAEHAAGTVFHKVLRFQVCNMERLMRALDKMRIDLWRLERGDGLAVIHAHAFLIDLKNVEVVKVVDDNEVRKEAGCDGAAVVEQEVARGMVGRALDGNDRIDARLDGALDDIVNMTLFQQVVGVLVVRAEHAVGVILRREQRQQRIKIAGGCALADHDILSSLQLGKGIAQIGALMVGVDAGGNVGVERVAGQSGRMTVDLLVMRLRSDNFFDHLLIAGEHAVGVHHLGKALHAGVLIEGVDGAVVERCAGLVKRRCRDAGRQHEAHIDRKVLGRLEHILDAVRTHDVGDLVRVGDDGGGTVRQDRLGKFLG